MLPESVTPNARAIEGRPMFTIDESSVVVNAAVPESASTIHLLADSCSPWCRATWADSAQAVTVAGYGALGCMRSSYEEKATRGENQEKTCEGERREQRVGEEERPNKRADQHGQH